MTSSQAQNEKLFYDVALQLVKDAGQVVRDAFAQSESLVTTKSSDTDLVTETDQAVEKMLFDGLKKQFPSHKFIGEESEAAKKNGEQLYYANDPTWIIDPIDGTTNFVHRCPQICISVGLTIGRQLRAAIIYNPILDQLYTARAGQGAYKNGFPIKTSHTQAVNRSIIAMGLGLHNIPNVPNALDYAMENFRKLVKAGFRGHRSFGSAALHLCYVADGSVDGYAEFGLHCWDMCAGALIVQEAGGCCIDPEGGDFDVMSQRVLAAATPALAKELVTVFAPAITYKPEAIHA